MKVRPVTGSPAPADVAADLRALADLVERDADGFVAAMVARIFTEGSIWPAHATGYEHEDQRAEVMAEAVDRFETVAAAPTVRRFRDVGAGYYDARIPMRALWLRLTDTRPYLRGVGA